VLEELAPQPTATMLTKSGATHWAFQFIELIRHSFATAGAATRP
jgi:hypothetical protein